MKNKDKLIQSIFSVINAGYLFNPIDPMDLCPA